MALSFPFLADNGATDARDSDSTEALANDDEEHESADNDYRSGVLSRETSRHSHWGLIVIHGDPLLNEHVASDGNIVSKDRESTRSAK